MLGLFILFVLGLLYPVRYIWRFGHDWALYYLLGWGIEKTKRDLMQLFAEQQKKENRRNGKRVRRMNHLINTKKALRGSLTALQLRLGVVSRSRKVIKQAAKLA